jgi:3-methyladenine DNA glycosylase AlkD
MAGGQDTDAKVERALGWLRRRGSQRNRDGMARFGIVTPKAFGVSMAAMEPLARRLRPDHALALALWDTGWHDARMLATMIDEPSRVTAAQMEQWCRDFDTWAVCDTACMKLFDRTPFAWTKIRAWSRRRGEYQKRAAFALLASLAVHDKKSPDDRFLALFPIVERAATDPRNYVRKGVSWALRAIGHRNPRLHAAATKLATRLAAAPNATSRWIGKDALRDLQRATVLRRFKDAATS